MGIGDHTNHNRHTLAPPSALGNSSCGSAFDGCFGGTRCAIHNLSRNTVDMLPEHGQVDNRQNALR